MDMSTPFTAQQVLDWASSQPSAEVAGECANPARCVLANYAVQHIEGIKGASVQPGGSIVFYGGVDPTFGWHVYLGKRYLTNDETRIANLFDSLNTIWPTFGQFVDAMRKGFPELT